jgi:hypothetical protein
MDAPSAVLLDKCTEIDMNYCKRFARKAVSVASVTPP